MNWNKIGILVSMIGLVSLGTLNMLNGNKVEQAVYTSTMLGIVFLCSWFSDRY